MPACESEIAIAVADGRRAGRNIGRKSMAIHDFIVKPSMGGICYGAVGKRCKHCGVV